MAALRSIARALAHPRRTYVAAVRRLVYHRGPAIGSWLRQRWVILKNPGAEIRFGKGCRLGSGFSLWMPHGGRFVVGDSVDFRRGFRAEIAGAGTVLIGNTCVFSYYSLIQCSTTIEIGNNAMFGQSSLIVDGNHRLKDVSKPIWIQGFDFRPITIADNVTTLTKVTILNSIGTKAIVAANSVVNQSVPAYSAVGGVPAKLLDYFGPPEMEPPEWAERRRARGEPQPEPRPNLLEVTGHSLTHGGGVSAFEHRFTTRLAELCDADEVNNSVAGAIACWHDTGTDSGDGGYARVLQRLVRPPDPSAEPPAGLVGLTNYGLNDLAALGPDRLAPFEHALRAIISRHRASAVFEESDPSVRASGGWAGRRDEHADHSGEGALEASAPGESVTIAVPAGFRGGTVALGFIAGPEGGAELRIELDGSDATTLDTGEALDPHGHRTGVVARLPGVAAGEHEIVARVESVDGAVAFDYWQIEPDDARPVLAPLAYPLNDSEPYAAWPHRPTAESIAELNMAIRRVAEEFGRGVIAVDVAALLAGRPELVSWEGRYPNDAGHAELARACFEALGAARPVAQKTGVST